MNLQKTRKAMAALLGAAALSLLFGAVLSSASVIASLFFVTAGTVLFFLFIAYSFSHWRCPHCGEYLGRVGRGIQFCPHCHGRIDT